MLSVRKHNPGDTVNITLNRSGEEITVEVVLGSDEGQTQQKTQQRSNQNYNNSDIYDL